MELNSNTSTGFSSAPGTKVRLGPDGIHLFARSSGMNLLIEEVVPPRSMWTTAPCQVSIALTNSCDLACSYCFAPKTRATHTFERVVSWLFELERSGIRVKRPDALLDTWAKSHRWADRVQAREYSLLTTDPGEIASRSHEYFGDHRHAFTQWFAAELRHPYTTAPLVSVYVNEFPDDADLRQKLGARRVEEGGRLRLVVPKDEGVFNPVQIVNGFPLVSDVQIYLDLVNAGLRGDEAANELRRWPDFSGGLV